MTNIDAYITKITTIASDLEARGIKLPDQVIAAWILSNLTKDFNGIITSIIFNIRNNQIDLSQIIAQLLDESRRLQGFNPYSNYNYFGNSSQNSSHDIEMAMATRNNNNSSRNNKYSNKNSLFYNYYNYPRYNRLQYRKL